jgi:hypothetical protein
MARRFKSHPGYTKVSPLTPEVAFFDAIAAVASVVADVAAPVISTVADIGSGIGGVIGDVAGTVGSLASDALGGVTSGVEGLFGGTGAATGAAGGAANAAGAVAPATLTGGGASALGAAGSPALAGGASAAESAIPIETAANSLGIAGGTGIPAAGTTAASAAAPAAAGGSFLKDLTSAKGLQTAISGAGLLNSVLAPQQSSTAQKNLENVANSQAAQGQQLQNYLTTGTLPPGVKNSIDLAEKNAEATIRSRYAAQGQSGSTAEAQDIANAKLMASNQGTEIALKLLNQGVSESQLSGELFNQILNIQSNQDQQIGSAIGNFASAIGGGGSGTFKISPAA